MALPVVLITERLDDRCADWLAERCDVRRIAFDDAAFDAALAEAEALVVRTYTQVNETLLAKAPRLRAIGRAGVGLDNFDLDACKARGVTVVHTPDANTQAVVEYVTGLMLDHFRPRTNLTAENLASFHDLRQTEVGTQIDRLTLGTWGFGRIGKRLGAVAAAMGMPVMAHDLIDEATLRHDVRYPVSIVDQARLLAASDILTIHVDGRSANRHLVNAEVLAQLKPNVLLINAARGRLVDHAALDVWLGENPKATAVLDVHDPEPPQADLPLLHRTNCRLLPHLASRTGPAMANMSWVVKDVWAVLEGKTPKSAAN